MCGYVGVDSLSQRLSSMRNFVQQQITTLTAKQVSCAATNEQCTAALTAWPEILLPTTEG